MGKSSARLMLRILFICIGLTTALPVCAEELWQLPWIEVRSPHFIVISALEAQRTVQLVRDLEAFRGAAELLTNIGRFEERIPTTVYVLPYAVPKMGFNNSIVGYFIPEMRANYAAVIPSSGLHIDASLKHEYTHFLIHNRDAQSYPTWFDEGFAELLQTMQAHGDLVEYGAPSRVRVEWLSGAPWISFKRVLNTAYTGQLTQADQAMFYAQSWLLVHYLNFGRPDRNFGADNSNYLEQLANGATPAAAFESAFGLRVTQIDRRLRIYATYGLKYYRMRLTKALPEVAVTVQPAMADEIAARLGLLLQNFREFDEAKRYWDAALQLNPRNAQALVGLGDVLKHQQRFGEAPPYYEKAIALEPHNALHELDYGEYFLDWARETKDPGAISDRLIEARRHFARSYKLDANIPETLAENGATYLFSDQPIEKALDSLRVAHALLPSHSGIKFLLAKACGQAGDRATATLLLRSLLAWDHGAADDIRKLLDEMGAPPGPAVEPDRPAPPAPAPPARAPPATDQRPPA